MTYYENCVGTQIEMDISENNRRIIRNTLFLYFRMFFTMLINLFTVRIVLRALGVEDYGIYNVIGGVVSMFSILGGSLASGTQRFLAFELGKKDYIRLKEVFNMTVIVYWIVSFIVLILLETLGLWFVNYKMNIPSDRILAANYIFQFSMLSFLVNMISIPYNALIIARERMTAFAYIGILEASLKLLCSILLWKVIYDKLIVHSILILLVTILIRCIYQIYCKRNMPESKFCFFWDVILCKSLLIYSGWNMIGSLALLLRNQGINIVLNLFFGPLVNAAHAIAQQVNGAISQLATNIYTSTRPQIVKYYANNDFSQMWNLVYISSKFSYYLLLLLCLPIFFLIDHILYLWLGEVPGNTVLITRLLILNLLIESMTNQIVAVFQAANKLRKCQSYSSSVLLFNVPVSYLLLRLFDNVAIPYLISIFLSIVYIGVQMYIAKDEIQLNVTEYTKRVMIKVFVVTILSSILPFILLYVLEGGIFYQMIVFCMVSFFSSIFAIWFIGLTENERSYMKT